MTKPYDNEIRGIMFEKDRQSDNHPLWKGNIQINGMQYWISGWPKQTSKGEAISLQIQEAKPATDAMPKQRAMQQPAQAPADFDDDIPF